MPQRPGSSVDAGVKRLASPCPAWLLHAQSSAPLAVCAPSCAVEMKTQASPCLFAPCKMCLSGLQLMPSRQPSAVPALVSSQGLALLAQLI